MADRPFITCHALDTTTGKPAVGVAVTLTFLATSYQHKASSYLSWTAETNNDGRVTSWSSDSATANSVNEIVSAVKDNLAAEEQMIWKLSFDTEGYFGKGNTFWPQVDLTFAAQRDETHYHVPLLLGPWSYTTYRGS